MKMIKLSMTKPVYDEKIKQKLDIDTLNDICRSIEYSYDEALDEETVTMTLDFSVSTIKQLHEAMSIAIPDYDLKYHTFRKRLIATTERSGDGKDVYTQVHEGIVLNVVEFAHIKEWLKEKGLDEKD